MHVTGFVLNLLNTDWRSVHIPYKDISHFAFFIYTWLLSISTESIKEISLCRYVLANERRRCDGLEYPSVTSYKEKMLLDHPWLLTSQEGRQ